ncbi:hypothetical protein MDA_GLEAN10025032 [Myotis davidii]|uniref:Uncharacterized protein n=1 Tax=Myotis davidii TaxID=225400 RepID=L5M7G3_MYODS|nr:hypothetical protein MDA_GLEAN10025032 [Myotis davidii]
MAQATEKEGCCQSHFPTKAAVQMTGLYHLHKAMKTDSRADAALEWMQPLPEMSSMCTGSCSKLAKERVSLAGVAQWLSIDLRTRRSQSDSRSGHMPKC